MAKYSKSIVVAYISMHYIELNLCNSNWWCRNSHQWDARSLRSRVTYTQKENKNTLQKAPVWSRPNTLRRLSQKSFDNSRVLERNQLRVPRCEEDVGAFIVVRSCLFSLQPKSFPCRASLILVGQVFSLQDKSCPCSPSPFLVEQVFRDLKRGGQVWAFILSGTPHKEWARPFLACGHGLVGLAKPYLIFYPLQLLPSPHLVRRFCANGQLGWRSKQSWRFYVHGGGG